MLDMLINVLYITREEAVAADLTHEGYAYGLPVYFDQRLEEANGWAICPKVPLLGWWLDLGQLGVEIMSWVFPGQRFMAPIRMTAKL